MKIWWFLVIVVMIGCLVQSTAVLSGDTKDQDRNQQQMDRLIELLITKNIISNDEATALKKELEEKKEEAPQKVLAPQADNEIDMLLNMLVDKGVITAEDAAVYRAELAIKKQEQKEKQKEYNVVAGKLIQIGTWAQIRYRHDKSSLDTWDVRRARLDIRGDVTERFDYRLQAEFGVGQVKLLDALIGYKVNPYLKVTFGQFKIPFSQENLLNSAVLESINRSQVVEALVARGKDVIGNHNGRDIGVMASGRFSNKDNRPLFDYAAGMFNGAGVLPIDLNDQKDFVGRLVFYPIKNLTAGAMVYSGEYTLPSDLTKKDTRQRIGGEFAYTTDKISLRGEYIAGKDGAIKKDGGYLQAGYFIMPQKLQGLFKFDTFDADKNVKKNESTIYTLGINWYVRKLVLAQLNYEIKTETGKKLENNMLTFQLRLRV